MNGIIVWTPGISLENIEKQVILKAYDHYRSNKTATAGALGISVRTLDSKLERYDAEKRIEDERREQSQQEREHQLSRARGFAVGQDTPASTAGERRQSADGAKANAGVRVESFANAPAKSPVPMPKPVEVQEMLSRQTAQHGNRKRG